MVARCVKQFAILLHSIINRLLVVAPLRSMLTETDRKNLKAAWKKLDDIPWNTNMEVALTGMPMLQPRM